MTTAARSAVTAVLLACVAAGAAEVLVMDRLGPVAAVALPVAAGVAVLVGRRPILGVQLALLAVPLEFFSLRVGGAAGLSPTEMLLLLAAAAALVRWSLTAAAPVVPAPLRAVAALSVPIVLGYAVAQDTLIVTKIFVMWSAFAVVGLLVANAERREVERVLACLAIAGGVAGFVAAAGGADQSLVAGGLIATNRAQAGFAQPNVLGFFLVMAIPAAVVLTLRGRPVVRVFMTLMVVGALWGVMLSLSRTSLVGTGLALCVLTLHPPFRRVAAVGVAALAIFALVNLQALESSQQVSVVAQRVATLGESNVVHADPRLKIYETTPSIVANSPLLGTGAGNYSFAAKRYGVLDENDQPFDHAHNVPLTFAAELGIPGLLILVWLAVSLARLVARSIAGRRDFGAPALAVAAALLGTVVTSMGDYPPRTNAIAATFLILVGALAALVRR